MKEIILPKPRIKGTVSTEEAMHKRCSVRTYAKRDISIEDVSQLLWACQGITDEKRGLRTAPSAGASYPLEIYIAKSDGLYHYIPEAHELRGLSDKDIKERLAQAAYEQSCVRGAAVDIIICAVYERVTARYGPRGIRYADMEAGHAAQNVFLQAAALGLDSVPIGAFADAEVARILNLPKDVKPLYILPVGYRE